MLRLQSAMRQPTTSSTPHLPFTPTFYVRFRTMTSCNRVASRWRRSRPRLLGSLLVDFGFRTADIGIGQPVAVAFQLRVCKQTDEARLDAAPWPIFSSTSADRDAAPIAGSIEMAIAFRMIVRSILTLTLHSALPYARNGSARPLSAILGNSRVYYDVTLKYRDKAQVHNI